MNKHAPPAPGPRPNTWWKKQRVASAEAFLKLWCSRVPIKTEIYTRPEPRKQGVKGK